MKVSLDTNILIDEPNIVFDKSKDFVLSFTVIRELDKLKRNPDVKRAAQMAIKNVWVQFKDDNIEILNVPNLLGDSPDEKIIQDTKDAHASILSNDIAVRIIAKAHGIDISDFESEDEIDYSYTGYQEIAPKSEVEYQKGFHTEKDIPLAEFQHIMEVSLQENEYCIVECIGDKNDIWKNINGHVYKISQKMGPYTAADVKGIAPLDDIQMCVLDAVFDPVTPLTIIDGKLGTGKTMLSVMAALATVQGENRNMFYDKIMVTASPESVNRSLYTGFKPGTSEEKMGGHLGGFKSNLKFLIDPKKDKTNRKNKNEEEQDKPSDIAWQENFEIIEIDEVQGTSLHNTILLVDEYQKLNTDSLKLILSRISENSKVVLIGDTQGQTYGLNRADEGYKTLYKHLGSSKSMNFIKMENIYRSKLAEFVEEIFE